MKPITPLEAQVTKQGTIPASIIEAVNTLLIRKYTKDVIVIKQDDIVDMAIKLDNKLTKAEIFENKWLDIEEFYRTAGWEVSYEKSNYNDTGPSLFKFKTIKSWKS